MTKRTAVLAAAGAALAAVVAWRLLAPAPPETDQERIRALFEAAARAAGEREASGVVEPLSERFRGHGLDRQGAKQLVALQLLRGDWVSASIAGISVTVEGDAARANVDAVLVRSAGRGKALADLVPGQAAAHRFACRLEREDGGWRVVEARWRQLAFEEALAGPPPPEDPGASR